MITDCFLGGDFFHPGQIEGHHLSPCQLEKDAPDSVLSIESHTYHRILSSLIFSPCSPLEFEFHAAVVLIFRAFRLY